ncbi:MAG: response regulator, partial [Cyclobacteriaceae bacterium]
MRRPVRIVAVDSLESLNLINVIIDNTSDFHLVNEYTELDKALKLISRDLPDIFLVDINHRNFRSPVSISSIKAKLPYVEVIALSDEVSDVLVKDCFSNGASGFIEKKS